MPRRAAPSTALTAHVRAWFSLTQAELALYLGISPTLVRDLETGRRALSSAVLSALSPLARHLPADDAPLPATAATLPAAPAPNAYEIDFRRRTCLAQAARLALELDGLAQQARAAQRWAQALPALLAATPAAAPNDDDPAAAATRELWRVGWLHRRARPLPPEAATRAALLRARIAGLRAEAAVLAATTAGPPQS